MALSQKDKKGVVLLLAAGAAVLAMVGGKIATGNAPKPGADGCVGKVHANTVIVLDHSEAVTEQTRLEIAARALAHVNDKVQTNERVTVFQVSEVSKKSLVPAFSRCKPENEGNRVTQSVKAIEKAYKRGFLEPLEAVLKVAPVNAKESPVAQALIDVSLTQYLRGKENSLLVFSDLMEHTPPKFSLYGCVDAERVIPAFREAHKGAQERPAFRNTAVSLNVIPRSDVSRASLKCRDKLWTWFFGDSEGKGTKLDFDYLPGA